MLCRLLPGGGGGGRCRLRRRNGLGLSWRLWLRNPHPRRPRAHGRLLGVLWPPLSLPERTWLRTAQLVRRSPRQRQGRKRRFAAWAPAGRRSPREEKVCGSSVIRPESGEAILVASTPKTPPPRDPTIARKTAPRGLEDDQLCAFFQKGHRVTESRQRNSGVAAGPSWDEAQQSRTSGGQRPSKPQATRGAAQRKSSRGGVSPRAGEHLAESIFPRAKAPPGPLGPPCPGPSGSKMFLDFQSLKIIKEDADQDSASDLSDSERVPIAPSPLTPPELNLRAEEIDPLCFDLPLGHGPAGPNYQYPDFLPPPFNSWDLRVTAALPSTEGRAGAVPRAGGALGRFLERLAQLQWLEEQTVQWERAKAAKGRAGPCTPKSPGRSKLLAAALSLPPQEGPSRAVPLRKKGPLRPEHPGPSAGTFEPCARTVDVPRAHRPLAPKPPTEGPAERKRASKAARLQLWDPPAGGADRRLENSGNLRTPGPQTLDPAHPRAARAQAHMGLRKKGSAGPSGHAPVSSEKKLRPNGAKPATPRFK